MTKEEILDINGKNPKVGDRIALAVGWGTNNAYLNICTIKEIVEHPKTVEVKLTTELTGLYNRLADIRYEWKPVIKFPMEHCKFIIL